MQGMRQKAADSMRLFTTTAADAVHIWETNNQPCRPVCVHNVLLMVKIFGNFHAPAAPSVWPYTDLTDATASGRLPVPPPARAAPSAPTSADVRA